MNYVSYQACHAGVPGSKLEIAGVRFNLSPMSDQFVDIILDSINKVDVSNIWSQTDHTSTVYRGEASHVFDALKACHLYAYRPGVHMVLEATISKGCPGDGDFDFNQIQSSEKINESNLCAINFPIIGKFSVYPMGSDHYMPIIEKIVNYGIDQNVISGTGHYVTFLDGTVHEIYRYLEEVFHLLDKSVSHFVIQVSLLSNLPEDEINE